MKTFLVGGAVRDKLLGKKPNDEDWVVVGATPDEMLAKGYQQVGADFPVFLHPETKDEYALARTERKTSAGYKGFNCKFSPDVTLEDDLTRRDLTINAIAMDENGDIIDPHKGQIDLSMRTLRHVSDAFEEDPLRILRVARFTAKMPSFNVAPETMQLMTDMVERGDIDELVPERVWQEFEKALDTPKPSRFIETLRHCGALEKILPEVHNLQGVPQPKQYHPEGCAYNHTLLVLDRAAELTDDKVVRFAAIMHDVGKGTTPAEILPKHIGHEGRSVELTKSICARLRVPSEYKEMALNVGEHHTHCHKTMEMKPGKIVSLLEAVGALKNTHGDKNLERFITTCKADSQGRGEEYIDIPYPQEDLLPQVKDEIAKVTGAEFVEVGHEPGPKIGIMVQQERIRIAKGIISDFKADLEIQEQDKIASPNPER